MNIPMAYDVVPSDSQPQYVNGVMVNQHGYTGHMNSVVVGSNLRSDGQAGVDQPLLLNDQEAQWAQEMQVEGLGQLPVSWYRQTPKQAVWGGYGLANRIISALVNFGINVGLGYAILSKNDEVGLWQEPPQGDNPYKSAAWSDLYITCFLITFLSTIISTPGIRDAMKKGQVVPVDAELLKGGWWRCLPVSMLGTCSRSLTLSLCSCTVLGTAMVLLMEVVCVSGGMHGSGAMCSLEKVTYIYVKAVYATVVAWCVYPIILLMTLNTATLPPLDLTFFAQNQRERWDKEQKNKVPEPL